MTSVRSRTLLAVAALVIAAGGVATAVATSGSTTPEGPRLVVQDAIIQAVDLFPTSSANPEPALVAQAPVPLLDDAPARITAACTCAPGTAAADQFEDLQIEVGPYRGPLAQLDATVTPGAVVKVWLADTGKPQVQGVTTTWEFTTTPTVAAPLSKR